MGGQYNSLPLTSSPTFVHHSESLYKICFQSVAGNELTQPPMLVERLASEPTVFQSLIQQKLLPQEQIGVVLLFGIE
jgi:hypothetical protein